MPNNTQNSNTITITIIVIIVVIIIISGVIFGLSAGCVLPNWFGLCKNQNHLYLFLNTR